MNRCSSNPLLIDSDLIEMELRSSGQSDAFLDDLDFILDEDGVADGDEVGIPLTSSSRRPSKSQESLAMNVQEFDACKDTHFDADSMMQMSYGIDSCHISYLCQSDMYEIDAAPLDEQQCFRSLAIDAQFTEAKYNEALQKLADSMQRTEETRRQVMLQRQILMPMQQQGQVLAQIQRVHQPPPPSPEQVEGGRSISPGRSSILNAFFSGSRCTLTNGLDQSRKQLSMYMTQINQQTF
jgi:hypothetical protein